MIQNFQGDWNIMRVCLASNNPIETLHKIRTEVYSIGTVLDMLEMLDVRDTMQEDEREYEKARSKQGNK